MAQFLALGGLKENGKDTFAEGLPGTWDIIGMSDYLFQSVLTLDPFIDDHGTRLSEAHQYHTYQELKNNHEVRRLLQVLGTEVGRNILGENIWVDLTQQRIERNLSHGLNSVVTGIRYPNEFQMVRDLGGTLVWVERPREAAPTDQHSSETSMTQEQFDVVVTNDGTVDNLHNKARVLSTSRTFDRVVQHPSFETL